MPPTTTEQERARAFAAPEAGGLGVLAAAAHEIANPLLAILGLSEFLVQEAEPGSRALQRLELIHASALEIQEILRGLLELARAREADAVGRA